MIQSARTRRRRRDSEEADEEAEQPEIDLFNLQINTLRRYKRYFKLASRPGLNKAQLAEVRQLALPILSCVCHIMGSKVMSGVRG